METGNRLYFVHHDPQVLQHVAELVEALPDGDAGNQPARLTPAMERAVEKLRPEDGAARLRMFFTHLYDSCSDSLTLESLTLHDGYLLATGTQGASGPYIMAEACRFFTDLVDDLEVCAWGSGDDDPMEYWVRNCAGHWWIVYDSPGFDPDIEEEQDKTPGHLEYGVLQHVMPWWHHGLPSGITEGYLRKFYVRDPRAEHKVFEAACEQRDRLLAVDESIAAAEEMFVEAPVAAEPEPRILHPLESAAALAMLNAARYHLAYRSGRINRLQWTIGVACWKAYAGIATLGAKVLPATTQRRTDGLNRYAYGAVSVLLILVTALYVDAISTGVAVLIFVTQLYLAVKRFRDIGNSEFWALLLLVPFLNLAVWSFLLSAPKDFADTLDYDQPGRRILAGLAMAFGFMLILTLFPENLG